MNIDQVIILKDNITDCINNYHASDSEVKLYEKKFVKDTPWYHKLIRSKNQLTELKQNKSVNKARLDIAINNAIATIMIFEEEITENAKNKAHNNKELYEALEDTVLLALPHINYDAHLNDYAYEIKTTIAALREDGLLSDTILIPALDRGLRNNARELFYKTTTADIKTNTESLLAKKSIVDLFHSEPFNYALARNEFNRKELQIIKDWNEKSDITTTPENIIKKYRNMLINPTKPVPYDIEHYCC